MTRQRPNRKPTFLPQAILIVLPVVILAIVGAWSLRQDRVLAQQEARDRAGQLADTLLTEIESRLLASRSAAITSDEPPAAISLVSQLETVSFQTSSDGRLVHPSPVTEPVPNPLDPTRLAPAAAELWHNARSAEFRDRTGADALIAYRQFLECEPPNEFATAAMISMAILDAQQGRTQPARDQLRTLIDTSVDTILESGLPTQPVAALKLIKLALPDLEDVQFPWATLLDRVASNAVHHPSWASRPFLDAAVALADTLDLPSFRNWHALWTRHESARQLFSRARPHLPASSPFWINSPDDSWLAVTESDSRRDSWTSCLPEQAVGQEIDIAWHDAPNVPPYLGVGVSMASRQYRIVRGQDSSQGQWQSLLPTGLKTMIVSNSPANPQPPGNASTPVHETRLASRSTVQPALGDLTLDVFLDDSSLLFARQRTRTFWFGALIVVSASTAMVGLVTSWRAFHRQQLLAETQSRFVSSVSHELRAPVGSIRLLAEGLESGRINAPDKQAEYFNLMGQECRRLTALIENVLDFSRIDQGRKQYEFEPTDILALIRQTVRLMEPQAAERQITLTVHLPPISDLHSSITDAPSPPTSDLRPPISDPAPPISPLAVLDGRAIQQALVNLIDNAIKHAPSNSTVEVGLAIDQPTQQTVSDRTLDGAKPEAALRLWVKDSGAGIPSTDHEKIFEPFYRRGTELRRETPGIGIGLSIVKHIVQAHGGHVIVESEPDHGSCFTLHLPVP